MIRSGDKLCMSWQLGCHGMCKYMSWADHCYTCRDITYFGILGSLTVKWLWLVCQVLSRKALLMWLWVGEVAQGCPWLPAAHLWQCVLASGQQQAAGCQWGTPHWDGHMGPSRTAHRRHWGMEQDTLILDVDTFIGNIHTYILPIVVMVSVPLTTGDKSGLYNTSSR